MKDPTRNAPFFTSPSHESRHNMAMLAFVFGVAAIGCNFFLPVILPMFLGSLSIIFAILSKGKERKMEDAARRGVFCSLLGLVISAVLFVTVLIPTMIRQLSDPAFRATMNQMSESLYGISYDEVLREFDAQFGTNLESLDKGGIDHVSSEII
ncbi:MAG: hypothetical protein Q4C60_09625 [Eubacteriales bacterium]|nr:hypothetical protein [Eubacteriales bacterium]